MVEAIGVASGVITFIDAGKKVLDLCARIKGAPGKVAAYQQDLEDALFNVESLKQRLQISTNPNISIARKDLDFVENLLIRCTEHLLALQQTLGNLDSQFKGGRRRHAWASLVAVRRSGEILGIFSKLQNGLNSLKSFLVQQNFWMLQGQSSAIAAAQTSLADLTASQSQNTQGLEESFAATSQRSAEYIIQELNRMLQSQTSEIIPKLDDIYAVSARRVQMDLTSRIRAPTPIVSPSHHLPINGVRYASAQRCTCKTRPVPTYRTLGAFYYQDRTKNVHESTCPLHERSTREVTFGLKMAIPALFSKVVQLAFSADFGAGGISISPAIKFPARIVDRKQSKGFRVLDSLCSKYIEKWAGALDDIGSPEIQKRACVDALESFCESVMTRLFPLLENGSVSAHDQDVSGATLLWVFAYTVMNYNTTHLDPLSSDHVCEVIGTMIQHFEADANVIVDSKSIMDVNVHWTYMSEKEEIGCYSSCGSGRLLQYGFELYSFTKLPSWNSSEEVRSMIFWSFQSPALAFDFGFPYHYQALFNKSLNDLNRFIRKGADWERTESGIPSAICICAYGWSDGLRRLLQVGVDPIPAFGRLGHHISEEAFPVFIHEGCPPFLQTGLGSTENGPAEVSMLEYLEYTSLENCKRILSYVIENRRQLAAWGLNHLPHDSLERNHIEVMQEKGSLLDKFALNVWKALKVQIGSIPENLFPGERPSVYFWIECILCTNKNIRPALEFLFDSGFTDVNIRDDRNRTVFWYACKSFDVASSEFLASKGAEIYPGAIRAMARSSSDLFYRLPDWLFDLKPQNMRDCCRCYCSSDGCTPANMFTKEGPLGHASRRILLPIYLSRLRSDSEEEAWLEVCRLEMFERLGMTHTCCERRDRDSWRISKELIRNDSSEDVFQGEDERPESILAANILIYIKLRARFGGDLCAFLRIWWAALDLFLPRDDTYDVLRPENSQSTEKAPGQWFLLPGLGRLHRIHDNFDEAIIWTIVRYYFAVVDSVTGFFDGQTKEIELDSSYKRKAYTDIGITLSTELFQYLSCLNVPLSVITWLDGSRKVKFTTSFEPSKGYRDAKRHDSIDTARTKRAWIEDSIIPLVTAGVIADLSEGRKIPHNLYEQLERDGLIVNGRLRLLEEQEDIFEQGMRFLGLG